MSLKSIIFILGLSFIGSAQSMTFSQAKQKLKSLYKALPSSFYCGCEIQWRSPKKLVPDWSSCGFKARKQEKRASRIEWEHVVPAWEFGHQRKCWQNGGRKNCSKIDKVFEQMEGDLHNLVPAIGEVNGDRSNFRFNMIKGEERVYGQCDAEVNFKRRIFEPATNIQGDIARTYFYFEKQYGLKISRKQKQLFQAWDKLDPISKEECTIHKKKAKLQGHVNPFVFKPCFHQFDLAGTKLKSKYELHNEKNKSRRTIGN